MKKTKSIIAILVILAMIIALMPVKVFADDPQVAQAHIQLNGVISDTNQDNVFTFTFDGGNTVEATIDGTIVSVGAAQGLRYLTVNENTKITFKFNTADASIMVDGSKKNLDANNSYTFTAVAKENNGVTIMDFNFGNQENDGPQLGFDGTVIAFDTPNVNTETGKATFNIDGVNIVATISGTAGTYAFNDDGDLEVDDGALNGIRIKLDNNFKSNEMSVYVMDGNTRKEIVVNGDNEATFNDVTLTSTNLHFGIEKKQGGNNQQQNGGPDDIEIDAKFTNTHMIAFINNVTIMDDADGDLKDTFVGKLEEAGTTDSTKTNEFRFMNVFGDAPVKEYEINGVTYKEGDDGVAVGEDGSFSITVPGAEKYTIRGTADEDAVVTRTIIWTNPNYVPKDAADAAWIEEFKLENGYGYVKAVYDDKGNLVNPNEYKSQNWSDKGVGNDGFGWISIYPGYRVVFEFVPEYGYQLTDIRINGQKLGVSGLMNQFEFKMPDTNIHFDAEFTKTEDIVKANSEKVSSGEVSLGNNKLDGGSAQLVVSDVELTPDKIKGFEGAAGEYKVTNYLNIDLYQVFYKGKADADDVWSNKIDELDNEVTITMKLEDGLTADDVVIVHNIHDGEEYEVIQIDSYDPETNTITFRTKSFSNYAIATKEGTTKTETETEKKETTNPSTGDNIVIFAVIFGVAVVGIFVITVVSKKSKKQTKH